MIRAVTLAALLHACTAPMPAPLDVAQIGAVLVESHADAWAMHDDNTGHSYYPQTFQSALELEAELIASDRAIHGRGIDVGIAQINSHNFEQYDLTPARALHACDNLAVSAKMLSSVYSDELAALTIVPTQIRTSVALDRTLETYNSGQPTGDPGYTRLVETAAQTSYAQNVLARYRAPAPITEIARAAPTPQPSTCFAGCTAASDFTDAQP